MYHHFMKSVTMILAASALTPRPLLAQKQTQSVYAPDQIIHSEKILGILDQAQLWTNLTTHVRHVTDGNFPVKAEVEVSLDPTFETFQDEWFPFKLPVTAHYKRCTVDLKDYSSQLSAFNRISVMVYPDMPDRAALWIEAIGAPSWTAATFPLRPGQWNKIHLNLAHLKPEERIRITKLMFGGTRIGRLPGDPQWQRYYLKDLRFETILPRRTQGWEVSDRYVSLSQIGFTPWHSDKKAIFSGSLKTDQFRVRSADDNTVCLSGNLETLTNSLGVFKVADFSKLQEEGHYYIEAGDTRSVVFPITTTPFRPAIEKYLYFLSCMRSGTETPAHPICFLDDAVREDTRESVDIVGGWFDASDLRLYISMSMTSILRPLTIAAASNPATDPIGRALRKEAQWGTTFFNKIWDDETGLPFTMICVHMPREDRFEPIRNQYYKNNNYWTDNVRGTADDRVVHTPWNSDINDGVLDNYAQHLGICAAGANVLFMKRGTAFSEADTILLEHTERHFKRMRDTDYVQENRKMLPGSHLMNGVASLALTLETAVLLHEVTGHTVYADIALQAADRLMSKQKQTLIATDSGDRVTGFTEGKSTYLPRLTTQPVTPLEPLIRLLESSIPVEDFFTYYARLKIHADLHVKPLTRQTEPYPLPFVVTETKKADAERLDSAASPDQEQYYIDPPVFSTYAVGLESYGLSRMAAFLNDTELQTIAANHLHWQLGKNPLSQSLLAEVGEDYKPDMMSTALGFIPGMMTIGIASRDGKPFFPQHYSQNEIYTQLTPYLQAMVQVHAPCILDGTVTRNGAPAKRIDIQVRSTTFNKTFTAVTDDNGQFKDLELPGGLMYTVETGNQRLTAFTAISGMKKSVNVDLTGGFDLTRTVTPETIAPTTAFNTELEVMVYGRSPYACEIDVHGYNVTPIESQRSVSLKPGVNKLTFAFEANSNADVPYAVMFTKKGEKRDVVSAVGTIRNN